MVEATACWLLWTLDALGIGAIVERSQTVFIVIRLAGAAYLVWLGCYGMTASTVRSWFARSPGGSGWSAASVAWP